MAAEDQKINSADETMVSELLQELSDCREDERQMENQTIAVISTAGAVLGAILTANFLTETKCADIIRISFVLSNIIFCTAFAYVITLGIAGVMRYHYVRDIEDRLHRLVPVENAEDPDDAFVHWFSYRSALVSRNVKHVGAIRWLPLVQVFFAWVPHCACLVCWARRNWLTGFCWRSRF